MCDFCIGERHTVIRLQRLVNSKSVYINSRRHIWTKDGTNKIFKSSTHAVGRPEMNAIRESRRCLYFSRLGNLWRKPVVITHWMAGILCADANFDIERVKLISYQEQVQRYI